jgi:hypothetical protein
MGLPGCAARTSATRSGRLFESLRRFRILGVVPQPRRELAEAERPQPAPHRRSLADTRNSSQSHCTRSIRRQRTTPSRQGSGPASTTRASAARCSAVNVGALPAALRSIRRSGPSALKRSTQSRTICSPTPPNRAASVRVPPSRMTASASRRRTCFACPLSRAKRRRSSPPKSSRSSIAAAMDKPRSFSMVMEWMPPPGGIAMCQAGDVQSPERGRHP